MTTRQRHRERSNLRLPSLKHIAGPVWLAMLLLPPVRQALESSMTLHMLVQYPAWLCAGALLVVWLPQRWQRGLQRFNEFGINGLLFAGLMLTVLMLPRLLDSALVDMRVESLKLLALALSGAALSLSWQPASTVVRALFMGLVLPMLAVVGTLYLDSSSRLCNAYLLGDQQTLGAALLWVAAGIPALWLLHLGVWSSTQLDERTAVTR